MGQPLVGISTGDLPSAGSILRQTAETFWKLEPVLQPAKILAFDPGEPRCSFAASIAFDYSHFAKSEVSVAPTLIIPATCRVATKRRSDELLWIKLVPSGTLSIRERLSCLTNPKYLVGLS